SIFQVILSWAVRMEMSSSGFFTMITARITSHTAHGTMDQVRMPTRRFHMPLRVWSMKSKQPD
ncbi:MAG: hypothetical protein ACTSSA_06510, partial [Candidatus Freyarchaeota archaeon]